jgi:DNA-binding XRE family transcriptional regulator
MIDTKELKVAMVRAGYNQKELAKACKVSNPTITRMFQEGRCGTDLAERISIILKIANPGEIFFATKIA